VRLTAAAAMKSWCWLISTCPLPSATCIIQSLLSFLPHALLLRSIQALYSAEPMH
jgi:hypothetical protein